MNKLFNYLMVAIFVTALALSAIGTAPVAAQAPQPPTQETCDAIVAKFKNVAQWDDTTWQACFAAGMVNAVVDPKHPLPEKFGPAIMEALEKGSYLQFTEPHGKGCDNTLAHPKCAIGFLKLFSSMERLVAFVAKGEFEQAGVLKKGPWDEYSLWMTEDFVQVSDGEKMTAEDAKLFCTGALTLSFAFDGGFPLPKESPCGDAKLIYSIGERWNGGCDGNALPNKKCNVGERLQVSTWKEVNASTIGSDWNRGSVRVVVASDIATATPTAGASLLPVITSTPATPSKGTPTAQPTNTVQPASTIEIDVYTVTPSVEVPTDESQAALPGAERPDGANVILSIIFFLILIGIIVVILVIRAVVRNNRRNSAEEQPADDGAGGDEVAQPGEDENRGE